MRDIAITVRRRWAPDDVGTARAPAAEPRPAAWADAERALGTAVARVAGAVHRAGSRARRSRYGAR